MNSDEEGDYTFQKCQCNHFITKRDETWMLETEKSAPWTKITNEKTNECETAGKKADKGKEITQEYICKSFWT